MAPDRADSGRSNHPFDLPRVAADTSIVILTVAAQSSRHEDGRPRPMHSKVTHLAGQLAAGFVLSGFYEDRNPGDPLDEFTATYLATLAFKMRSEC